MLFNSLEFLFFFILTTILYFVLAHKYRWLLLLIASCFFYMFFIPIYILILFLTIGIDYIAGIYIEKSFGKKKLFFLIISLFTNIGVLLFFKYYNFFTTNINQLKHFFNINSFDLPYLNIILPVGLSFHTFQAMSYTIEVYREKQKAERNIGIFALYVMFYPQLVAGPIERPQNVLYQFYEKHYFEFERIKSGLKWMVWGLFKKVVIADRLAIMVDNIYNNPTGNSGLVLLIATIFFAIQIYCDFSGYTDIAIGSARILGFKLSDNFKQPYFAKSLSEFWTRWHISLSTWFKDYLYIPLGGNRVKITRVYFNLFIVFLISGIWHGASWTFVIWGALHGLFLILSDAKTKYLKMPSFPVFLNICSTFLLVSITWIFFRANNITDALYFIKQIFFTITNKEFYIISKIDVYGNPYTYLGVAKWRFFSSFILIFILFTVDYLIYSKSLNKFLSYNMILRWTLYYILCISIFIFGVYNVNQFIYFQF